MYKNIVISLSLLFCFCSVGVAQYNPYSFLRNNSSARSAALAGASMTIQGDAGLVFFNPALISTVSDNSISATFLKHISDINSGNVIYIKGYDEIGTFSANAAFMSYGSFIARDKHNNQLNTFNPMDIALSIGYGNELDSNLYYGAAVKFIFSTIYKSSTSAAAFDFGLFYKIPDINTNIGISVLNAGFQLSKINDYSESLPLDIRIGANHKLVGLPLLINFSFHHLADKTDNFLDKFMNFSLGGEIYFGENIMARIGYDNYIRKYTAPDGSKGISGLSFGAGIKFKPLNIDYAFSRIGLGANLHRLGVNFQL